MVGTRYLVCGVALLALGCHHLSPAEQRIAGTWSIDSIDSTIYVIFERDHTVRTVDADISHHLGTDLPVVISTGVWRLEGDSVVVAEKRESPDPDAKPVPHREVIYSVRDFDTVLRAHPSISFTTFSGLKR